MNAMTEKTETEVMPAEPLGELCRWGEAVAWCASVGITEWQWRQAVDCRVIRRIRFHPGGRCFYKTAEIRAKLIAPVLED